MSGFALLLGFALLKVVLGAVLIYAGFRGGERDGPHGGFDNLAPEPPPVRPSARKARRTGRGGPARSPARAARRPVRT